MFYQNETQRIELVDGIIHTTEGDIAFNTERELLAFLDLNGYKEVQEEAPVARTSRTRKAATDNE